VKKLRELYLALVRNKYLIFIPFFILVPVDIHIPIEIYLNVLPGPFVKSFDMQSQGDVDARTPFIPQDRRLYSGAA